MSFRIGMSAAGPVPDRRPRRGAHRRGTGMLALLVAGATAVSSAVLTVSAMTPAQARQSDTDVEFVTANLKSALSVERFQADVAEVLAHEPDFIAYNEVPVRQDSVLAPKGYAIYRGQANRYTRATPVVWRTDRWSAVDTGTYKISDYRKVPDGKKVKLGLRYANWATLRSDDGRQVTIVSMHVAPVFKDDGKTYDLLRPSVKRLAKLATLVPKGPMLVGGDFNVHYRSGRYPRDILSSAALVPTYDTVGTSFPTGDHGAGATIDYVFNRGANQLRAVEHHPHEDYSDHDLVVAGLDWRVDPPSDTQRTVSNPDGSADQQRAALRRVLATIRGVPSGGRLGLASSDLTVRRIQRTLRRAALRGVTVRYVTRSRRLTSREQRLARFARSSKTMMFQQCDDSCADRWRSSDIGPTLLLTRDTEGSPRLRADADRRLNRTLVERQTTVVSTTGQTSLQQAAAQLAALR